MLHTKSNQCYNWQFNFRISRFTNRQHCQNTQAWAQRHKFAKSTCECWPGASCKSCAQRLANECSCKKTRTLQLATSRESCFARTAGSVSFCQPRRKILLQTGLVTAFSRAVSHWVGAAMSCLAWTSSAVSYWGVSLFLARPVERKCYWVEPEDSLRELFKAINYSRSWVSNSVTPCWQSLAEAGTSKN